MRKKPIHNTTTALYKHGHRSIDGKDLYTKTATGLLKVCMDAYPRITLNVMYKQAGKNYSKLKPNIIKLKVDIIKALLDNGFVVQEERKPKHLNSSKYFTKKDEEIK